MAAGKQSFWDTELADAIGGIVTIGLGLLLLAGLSYLARRPPAISTAVRVSMRASMLDSSTGVLQLHNQTSQPLMVDIVVENMDSQQEMKHYCKIPAFQTVEIGLLETGWVFEPNEQVAISADGYRTSKWKTHRTVDGKVGIK